VWAEAAVSSLAGFISSCGRLTGRARGKAMTMHSLEGAGSPARAAAGEPVDVSVLVPTLNEEAYIEDTITELRRQRFNGRIEFLFIDGGSEDRTREIVSRASGDDPRIRLLDNPRRLIPHALNIGLKCARGVFVARMDAHSLPPLHYLAVGVERLRRGDVDWVSGPQVAVGRGGWSSRVALALSTRMGVGGASFRNAARELEVDTGFLGVWRRETLLDQRGWDEGWPINEDSELAARVRAAGGHIVSIPEMAVGYTPRDSLRALARQYWRYGQYRAKTCGAHPESMRRSHVLPPALVLTSAAAALPTRRVASLARASLVVYLMALIGTALTCLRKAGPRDAWAVPVVLSTMHFTWGLGFLVGSVRFGPPVAALASLLRGRRP
jgi:succinoglycan biosynthesis protein ExoA